MPFTRCDEYTVRSWHHFAALVQIFNGPLTRFNPSSISVDIDLTQLEYGQTYYRRVTEGGSDWSVVWSFTTAPLAPPRPTLEGPSDGATDRPTTLMLSWNYTVRADSTACRLPPPSSTVEDVSGITSTSHPVSGLQAGTPYWWQVRAHNARGWSEQWSAATNVSTNPTLDWGAASAIVESYRLEVRDTRSGTLVENATLDGVTTAADVSGLARGVTYTWRVRAQNAGGKSGWATRSFTVVPYEPAPPRLVPARATTGQPLATNLQWRPSPFHAVPVATQGYESTNGPWDKTYDNQSRTSAEVLFRKLRLARRSHPRLGLQRQLRRFLLAREWRGASERDLRLQRMGEGARGCRLDYSAVETFPSVIILLA